MSEAVQASSSTDAVSKEAAPVSATVQGVGADRQKEAAAGTPEDEQHKFHQQMLYPTAGQRNYGFPDKFMIFTFKVEPCKHQEKHARGSCPFAHPGDVALRRHPDTYQALLCPEVRAKKVCPRGHKCQCSHSAWEFWLHPDRYRTSMCEKGARCSRPVCFFAHNEGELRPLPAGLRPAMQPAEDTAKRQGGGRTGSISGTAVLPRELTAVPPGLTPGGMQGMPMMYMQGMQGMQGMQAINMQGMQGMNMQAMNMQGQHGLQRPPMQAVMQGYAQPGYGYASTAYRPAQASSALAVGMQGQYMGAQSPGSAQASGLVGQGMLLGGKTAVGAAATQQFSLTGGVSVRGLSNPEGSVWQQQQQQLQQGVQGSALAAAGTSMQLSQDPLLQQFQQMSIGRGALTPSSYEAANAGLVASMQVQAQQYTGTYDGVQQMLGGGVHQMLGSQQGMQHSWAQQQQQQQQAHAQVQYGLPQYATSGIDALQHSPAAAAALQQQHAPTSPVMSQMLQAQMDPTALAMQQQQQQQMTPNAAFAPMQGIGQPWAPAGMVFSTQDADAALLAAAMPSTRQPQSYAGGQSYGAQGGW